MSPPSGARVELVRQGLRLVPASGGEGEVLPLLAGSMHYWRVHRDNWDRCLAGMADLGLAIVTTYVPWSVHEVDRGAFDFGARDPQLNLRAFCEQAAGRGLKVFLRPGPHINAELTRFGYPARLLDIPEVLARGPHGEPVILPSPPRMFPVPSYASEVFYDEAALFLDAFAREAAPLLWPDGPVVGLQSDNEMCLFFRTAPYDQDYHPDAVALYRAFLGDRYGDDLALLGRAYGRPYRTWDSLYPPAVPPAVPQDLPAHRDWMDFKGRLMAYGVGRVRSMLHERGLGSVPCTHNLPAVRRAPFDIGALEREVDACGLDFYMPASGASEVRDCILHLSAVSRFPWLPEFSGGGFVPFGGAVGPDDTDLNLAVALLCGVRGLNVFMAVERDRFYGAPLDVYGRPRPRHHAVVRRILQMFRRAGLHRLERHQPALLLSRREDDLDAALSNPWTPLSAFMLPHLGLPEDAAVDGGLPWGAAALESRHRIQAWAHALQTAPVSYALADTAIPQERLAAFDVLISPAGLPEPAGELSRLLDRVRDGAVLVVPPATLEDPRLARNRPVDFELPDQVLPARQHGRGGVLGVELPAAGPAEVRFMRQLSVALQLETGGYVEGRFSSWFTGDGRRVVAAANLAEQPRRGALRSVGEGEAVDLWTGRVLGTAEGLQVELPALSCGFWEIR